MLLFDPSPIDVSGRSRIEKDGAQHVGLDHSGRQVQNKTCFHTHTVLSPVVVVISLQHLKHNRPWGP